MIDAVTASSKEEKGEEYRISNFEFRIGGGSALSWAVYADYPGFGMLAVTERFSFKSAGDVIDYFLLIIDY